MHVSEYANARTPRVCEWLIKFSYHLPSGALMVTLVNSANALWITIPTGWLIHERTMPCRGASGIKVLYGGATCSFRSVTGMRSIATKSGVSHGNSLHR